MIPLQAAATLLTSLASLPPSSPEGKDLAAAAACRITGHAFPVDNPLSSIPTWVPSDVQLDGATKLDTSLFAVEAQNLFVDPAREARRWSEVLAPCTDGEILSALAAWTAPGLKALARLREAEGGDGDGDGGVLGWGSRPGAHAVAVRIAVCSAVLAGRGYPDVDEGVAELGGTGALRI